MFRVSIGPTRHLAIYIPAYRYISLSNNLRVGPPLNDIYHGWTRYLRDSGACNAIPAEHRKRPFSTGRTTKAGKEAEILPIEQWPDEFRAFFYR